MNQHELLLIARVAIQSDCRPLAGGVTLLHPQGNCNKDAVTRPQGGIILMGGGTDVDEAFKQQISMPSVQSVFLFIT